MKAETVIARSLQGRRGCHSADTSAGERTEGNQVSLRNGDPRNCVDRGRDARCPGTPRTDPGVRDSRTGLPPRVIDGETLIRPRMKDARER